jgi:hypothetical protein
MTHATPQSPLSICIEHNNDIDLASQRHDKAFTTSPDSLYLFVGGATMLKEYENMYQKDDT